MPKNLPTKRVDLKTADIPGAWFEDKFSQFYTVHPCRALPIRCFDIPGHSYIDIEFGSMIESLPALSPLKDGWTYTVKAMFWPYRLGLPALRKNLQFQDGTQDDVKFPYLDIEGKITNVGPLSLSANATKGHKNFFDYISTGSVFERLGYSPGEFLTGQTFHSPFYRVMNTQDNADFDDVVTYDWNTRIQLLPLLAYFDCWDYMEYNKQDRYIPVVSDTYSIVDEEFVNEIKYFEYSDFQKFMNQFKYGEEINIGDANSYNCEVSVYNGSTENVFVTLRPEPFSTASPAIIPNFDIFSRVVASTDSTLFSSSSIRDGALNAVDLSTNWTTLKNHISKVGLLPTTLYGDKFTTWFNEDNIMRLERYVVTSGMTLTQLRQSNNSMYLELLSAISGDKYVDMLSYVYDTALELKDHPICVGTDSIQFNMSDVLSQSQGDYGERNTTLGSTASKAYVNDNGEPIKGKPIKFKAQEPGLLLFYGVLTPRVRYFQGEDRFFSKFQYSSLWHPQYSSQGFADIRSDELYKTVLGTPLYDSDDWANIWTADGPFVVDKRAVTKVPVGWEYMMYESRASAGATLPWYRTWSLVRDFNDFLPDYELQREVFGEDGFETYVPQVDILRSTYGNESSFNYNFANVGQDAENFIVLTEFKFHRYYPMSQNLLSRSI